MCILGYTENIIYYAYNRRDYNLFEGKLLRKLLDLIPPRYSNTTPNDHPKASECGRRGSHRTKSNKNFIHTGENVVSLLPLGISLFKRSLLLLLVDEERLSHLYQR